MLARKPGVILALLWTIPCGNLSFVLCDAQAAEAKSIRVGSKKFTENVILGEIACHLISDAGFTAKHIAELGGTQILWKALLAGDIDLYPDYTGTILQEILADDALASSQDLHAALRRHDVLMLEPLGFDNTYAIGMKEWYAAELNVRTISDLVHHPGLKFGFSNEFMQRADGWPGMQQRYRLPQRDVQGLDHDLAYRGLEAGAISVMDMYSTDAEIEFYELRRLVDDRGYFPPYAAVYLCRADLAERAPSVMDSLGRIEGQIDDEAMIHLNARVKLQKQPARVVAAEFLRQQLGVTIDVAAESRWAALARYTWQHISLVVLSLVPGIVAAIVLGVLAAKLRKWEPWILGVAGVIQTIPALALLVMMIPLLGIGSPPAIFSMFLYSLLPIVRATHQGLTGIAGNLQETALALGLPAIERFRRIELPLAMPAIVSGIKVAAVMNVGFATLGALIGAGGYGQPITTGIRLDDTGLILMGAIPSALLALAVERMFTWSERWIVPRGLRL